MHKVKCSIALGGDNRNVMVLAGHKAVTWPEVAVLQEMHGENAVFDIEVEEEVENPRAADEKQRLQLKYGSIVETVYPGKNPSMEWNMPGGGKGKKAKTHKKSEEGEDEEATSTTMTSKEGAEFESGDGAAPGEAHAAKGSKENYQKAETDPEIDRDQDGAFDSGSMAPSNIDEKSGKAKTAEKTPPVSGTFEDKNAPKKKF